MFDNIGTRLKSISKFLFTLSVFGGAALCIYEFVLKLKFFMNISNFNTSIVGTILGVLISFAVSALISAAAIFAAYTICGVIYGLGELIDNTSKPEDKTCCNNNREEK